MLRDYQQLAKTKLRQKWKHLPKNRRNVYVIKPTGAGKTKTMAVTIQEAETYSLAIAHRAELVGQISMALAREEVKHRIIAPTATVKAIIDLQVERLGKSWYHPAGDAAVAGIDTLIRREDDFFAKVGEWHIDEGHHVLELNKWGKGVGMLPPTAAGALWTATPLRSDRMPLLRGKGGLGDDLVVGPSMRELIDQGHLCDYRIFGLPEGIERAHLHVTAGGDFSGKQLREEAHKSTITGDLVLHYQRLVPGKQCVVFAVDIALAGEHAEAYRAAGIGAEVVHGEMGEREREKLIRRFEAREFPVLINVDILGEGFDCPGIEVVQMARPTASYGLFVQQFGRALRPLPGKRWGILLDHVGNVKAHGLPDKPREWSLDAPPKRKPGVDTPIRYCTSPLCGLAFESWDPTCTWCGHRPEIEVRAAAGGKPRDRIEVVEGDLTELTPDLLAAMRSEGERIMNPIPEVPYGAPPFVAKGVASKWEARRNAQLRLRDTIAEWAGYMRDIEGQTDSASYRRFFLTFGLDVEAAKALGAKDAHALADRITAGLPAREKVA